MSCIFCRIINGEIPSYTLYEDSNFKAIMDISPSSKGHTILIPKKHANNLFDLDEESACKALSVAKEIGAAMMEELKCEGLNILQNNNEIAGQTVFHFHIHLIPRYKEDSINISWQPIQYNEGEADTIAKAILERLNYN